MKKRIFKRLIPIYFQIGVDLIGIPKIVKVTLTEVRKELNVLQRYSYVVITLLLISCGSRKVEVEKTDLKTAELTKVDTDTKISSIDICDMLEIEPIDTTKPIIINGFTYKNAKIKRKQSKTETKIEIKDKSVIDKKSSLKTAKKQVDRKSKSVLWLWLIILILFFLIIYRKKDL